MQTIGHFSDTNVKIPETPSLASTGSQMNKAENNTRIIPQSTSGSSVGSQSLVSQTTRMFYPLTHHYDDSLTTLTSTSMGSHSVKLNSETIEISTSAEPGISSDSFPSTPPQSLPVNLDDITITNT